MNQQRIVEVVDVPGGLFQTKSFFEKGDKCAVESYMLTNNGGMQQAHQATVGDVIVILTRLSDGFMAPFPLGMVRAILN